MQAETLSVSWPIYDAMELAYECDYSSLFELIDCPFGVSLNPFSPLSSVGSDHMTLSDDLTMSLEDFDHDFTDKLQTFGVCSDESVSSFSSQLFSPKESYDQWSPNSSQSTKSESSITSTRQILILPTQDTETDKDLSVSHLLRAFGDALEMNQTELAGVILRRISEVSGPLGKAAERIGFYLSREAIDSEFDYLKDESTKRFDAALNALNRVVPHAMYAHFTANSTIVESTPEWAETIHVVDFDIGEGLQLASMIEAVARRGKRVKVTAIKWETRSDPTDSSFEATKRNLVAHARSYGVDFELEETRLVDLISVLNKETEREFFAFNCLSGLPHMGRVRSRRVATEFVTLAKEFLSNCVGILVLGDGEPCERLVKTCPSFGSFFEGNVLHYKALLEAVESGFSSHVAEARVAVECLFVAPYVSSRAWLDTWEEVRGFCVVYGPTELGFEGLGLSEESVYEMNEMVRREGYYGVRIEGNEAHLEWNGISLCRVSAWKVPMLNYTS